MAFILAPPWAWCLPLQEALDACVMLTQRYLNGEEVELVELPGVKGAHLGAAGGNERLLACCRRQEGPLCDKGLTLDFRQAGVVLPCPG